jgi:hypothetical protein
MCDPNWCANATRDGDELDDWTEGPCGTNPGELLAELTTLRDTVAKLQTEYVRVHPGPCVVCLCGSTRFMDAFHETGWQLTLDGYIVLTVGVCKHAEDHGGEALGQDVADKLDELHLRKIDLADWVLILNVGGYIGQSTRKELEYAKLTGKKVTFLEPEADKTKGGSDG